MPMRHNLRTMDNLITLYQQRLNLQNATFSRIDHDDAMVAIVYKIIEPSGKELILKICTRTEDYMREVYFLKHFAGILPVPGIIKVIHPEAILMECLPGTLLTIKDITDELAFEIGLQLARIHLNRTSGYGDLTQPHTLSSDPRIHFTYKFEEGLSECNDHLPKALLEQCRRFYDIHSHLLDSVDGPCMIHRDFRPGNLIINNGKLQGIIDWSSGRASFAEDDFCPMEHGEWAIGPALKKAFLEGYGSIRKVPDYSAIMPLLRLNKAIATIGFTVKRKTWDTKNTRVYNFNYQFLETFF